jgi:O-antigen/teichoic acid export membrane protein
MSRQASRDRALVSSGAWGLGARLVASAAAIATTGILARSLPHTQFGFLVTLMTLVGVLGPTDLGLGSAITSEIARARGAGDGTREELVEIVGWQGLCALGALVLVAVLAVTYLTGAYRFVGARGLSPGDARATMAPVAVAVALGIPAAAGARIQMGRQRGDAVARWALLATIASLASISLALLSHAHLWVIAASATLTPVAVLFLQTVSVLGRDRRGRPENRGSVFGSLARTGGLFLVLNIATVLSYQTDVLVVADVVGAAAAGILAVHTRLFGAIGTLTSAALAQVWPAQAHALVAGDMEWVRKRFARIVLALGAVSGAAALALALVATRVVDLWVGTSFRAPWLLIAGLAIWTFYGAIMSQFSQLLNAANVVRPQVIMATAMTAVNIPASIFLAGKVGIAGPIVATLVCHFVVAGVPASVMVRRVLRADTSS